MSLVQINIKGVFMLYRLCQILLLLIISPLAFGNNEILNYTAGNQKTILIHNSFGDVHIAPSTSNKISIVASKKKWGARCLLNIDPKAKDAFHIEINDQGWVMDNECRVDLIVSIPQSMKVILRAGNGNVDVVGTRGDLDVKVGSGKIRVQSELKSLSALTASGDIQFKGWAEKTQIKTGYGDIELTLQQKGQGRVVADAGKGDVLIMLPENSKVSAKTSTGNGYVTNSFSNSKEAADLDLQVSSGDGDVRIREN
ncbi:MAG: DUF4097 family beta strand repeat protein [Bdellovibrionales bacterium]|nr:DUF4097 family beta strand repeat protein [Bdellovibrionales bacterium]